MKDDRNANSHEIINERDSSRFASENFSIMMLLESRFDKYSKFIFKDSVYFSNFSDDAADFG